MFKTRWRASLAGEIKRLPNRGSLPPKLIALHPTFKVHRLLNWGDLRRRSRRRRKHAVFGLKLDKATFHAGLQDGGGLWRGWWAGGGAAVRKLSCQWRRTIGEDRGGAADKKHNKTHRVFVRIPLRKLRQTLLVFAVCCISAREGRLRRQTERVPLLLFCSQPRRATSFVLLIQLCQEAEVWDEATIFITRLFHRKVRCDSKIDSPNVL